MRTPTDNNRIARLSLFAIARADLVVAVVLTSFPRYPSTKSKFKGARRAATQKDHYRVRFGLRYDTVGSLQRQPKLVSNLIMSKHEKRAKRSREEATTQDTSASSQTSVPIHNPPSPDFIISNPLFSQSQQFQPGSLPAGFISSSIHTESSLSTDTRAQSTSGKIAIPKLRASKTTESSSKSLKKGRIPHACDNCRKAKSSCTGEQPCLRCSSSRLPCVYGDNKRDKNRKKANVLYQQNLEITEALKRIQLDTDLSKEGMRVAIDEVLSMTHPESREIDFPNPTQGGHSEEPDDLQDRDEQDDVEDRGSTGSHDVIDVDIDRDEARPTGHMGKSSSVAWAKRTAEECRYTDGQEPSAGIQYPDLVPPSYHAEDADFEYLDVSNINMYERPESKLAEALLQSYFDHVHPVFPILEKESFKFKYNNFRQGSSDASPEDLIWLGTLNIIFAIMSYYAQLVASPHHGLYHDHLIYCARAKMLCMDQRMMSLLSWSAVSTDKLYAILPWWSTIHYICEALAVLMLEMALRSQHMPTESAFIFDDAKLGISWLAMMSSQSISARKAWEVFDKLIRRVAPLINWSVFDIPTEAPIPPGYNWRRPNIAHPIFHPRPPQTQVDQLPRANLQQYEHTLHPISHLDATSAWTAQPSSFQPFRNGRSFPNQPYSSSKQLEHLGNPLDHMEALNRFSAIGNIHGHYDDPWMHMFYPEEQDHAQGMYETQQYRTGIDEGYGAGAGMTYHDFGNLNGNENIEQVHYLTKSPPGQFGQQEGRCDEQDHEQPGIYGGIGEERIFHFGKQDTEHRQPQQQESYQDASLSSWITS
ncbi:hypothetical protein G7Y89_g10875 [Cudoniella acicularis]|uniref:Zn(2)-C6 fungal-type domain-containing protein n=1 Tax=Cudoniella acicularis TaxID=354080 RepID=A0A8H4VYK7_9HELO|nr:hypothetical protein G7Y89_g10875 [Cudoniella acicularis]